MDMLLLFGERKIFKDFFFGILSIQTNKLRQYCQYRTFYITRTTTEFGQQQQQQNTESGEKKSIDRKHIDLEWKLKKENCKNRKRSEIFQQQNLKLTRIFCLFWRTTYYQMTENREQKKKRISVMANYFILYFSFQRNL